MKNKENHSNDLFFPIFLTIFLYSISNRFKNLRDRIDLNPTKVNKMAKINPYIVVQKSTDAIKLYEDLFGAKIVVHMPFEKEMGAQMGLPEDYDYGNSTMHAELDISGAKLMLSDNTMGKTGSGNVMIYVEVDSKDAIDDIYEKIKKKEFQILMDLQHTFWGSWYMMFEDSYGVGWQVGFAEGEVFPSG